MKDPFFRFIDIQLWLFYGICFYVLMVTIPLALFGIWVMIKEKFD